MPPSSSAGRVRRAAAATLSRSGARAKGSTGPDSLISLTVVPGSLDLVRWTVHGERALYESEWVELLLADVEIPGGDRFEHHVVRLPRKASGTIVHDPDRGLLLLWRHRFITDTWGWELPAGLIDEGETPEEAAA